LTENLLMFDRLLKEYNDGHENVITIKYNEPMSRHTTFRIGGPADLYLIPKNQEALIHLCNMLRSTESRAFFLGNGSNVLFDDEGFRGAVVSLGGLCGIRVDGNTITADSGALLSAVCKNAKEYSLTGLEFAYGIPGSVGGAVYMNAGAYNGEISHVLTESTYLDLDDGTVHTIDLNSHNFGYRESIYKRSHFVILSASFKLKEGNKDEIGEVMNDFMNRRVTKQPLEYPSAGSVFKRYPGRFTGQMIDECGLKGFSIGGAAVSEKHAGFIINKGGATASDVRSLIEHIKKSVFDKFGCAIECEVIYVK